MNPYNNHRSWSNRIDCFRISEPRDYLEQIVVGLAQALSAVTYRVISESSNHDVLFWLPDDMHGLHYMNESADRYYVAVEDGHLAIQLNGHYKIVRFNLSDPNFEEQVREFWEAEHNGKI